MRCLTLILALAALPAFASDSCDDLWFTRNLVFDRAGYCFGSVLGQAVFDNGDCVTKNPVLSAEDRAIIDAVKAAEREYACKVDTTRMGLNLPGLAARKAMATLPVLDIFESACFGWLRDEVVLFDGIGAGRREIGVVRRGDDIFFQHVYREPFDFVTVYRDEVFQTQGWGVFTFGEAACEMAAG